MPTLPERAQTGARVCYSFNQFADLGFLHYVNKELLNPKGLALSLDYGDGETEPRGWSLYGFNEPVEIEVGEDSMEKYKNLMILLFDMAKEHGRMPQEETDGNS